MPSHTNVKIFPTERLCDELKAFFNQMLGKQYEFLLVNSYTNAKHIYSQLDKKYCPTINHFPILIQTKYKDTMCTPFSL